MTPEGWGLPGKASCYRGNSGKIETGVGDKAETLKKESGLSNGEKNRWKMEREWMGRGREGKGSEGRLRLGVVVALAALGKACFVAKRIRQLRR